MNTPDKALYFKREALKQVIKAFDNDLLENRSYRIPFDIIPQDSESVVRCCVYKERAVLRCRALAALGFSLEKDDEATSLNEYARVALLRKELPEQILTVIGIACKGCVKAHHLVTEACQGCLSRGCQSACRFGAISFVNGRSFIDKTKCVNCGQCKAACPYNAIAYIPVPCEQACPVGAISKDEKSVARIDFDKCIACGQCMLACPFGAIMECSQMIDILGALKSEDKVSAIIAPSIVGQFDCSLPQLMTALKKAGFDDVVEVAQGADITTTHEAKELVERLESGAKFMTTSCCPAYTQAVNKHLPQMKEFVSHTCTPMHYSAELEKQKGNKVVFIGPCVAKRVEGKNDPNVDFVMTYEELYSLLDAKGINPAECEEMPLDPEISGQGRYFAVTGGVAKAVETAVAGHIPFKLQAINGLDKKSMLMLQAYAKGVGDFQLLEVMSCKGGCIGGPGVVKKQAQTIKPIKELSEKSPVIKSPFEKKEK